jgi:hypothetical protein
MRRKEAMNRSRVAGIITVCVLGAISLGARAFPDITHSRTCQYPVADWDVAFALTEGRECVNPRPKAMEQIYRYARPHTVGFIT